MFTQKGASRQSHESSHELQAALSRTPYPPISPTPIVGPQDPHDLDDLESSHLPIPCLGCQALHDLYPLSSHCRPTSAPELEAAQGLTQLRSPNPPIGAPELQAAQTLIQLHSCVPPIGLRDPSLTRLEPKATPSSINIREQASESTRYEPCAAATISLPYRHRYSQDPDSAQSVPTTTSSPSNTQA